MGRAALGHHLQLHPALVAAIDVHLGRLANHNHIGLDLLDLHQHLAALAVAVFFHVAKVIDGVTFQQAQVAGQGDAVDHAGRGLLLVAGAAGVQDAVLHLALEGVPAPIGAVADVDGVDVRVVQQHSWARAHSTDDVAHRSKRASSKPRRCISSMTRWPTAPISPMMLGMAHSSRMKAISVSRCAATRA